MHIFIICRRLLSARSRIVRPSVKPFGFCLLLLAGCATFDPPVNTPVAAGSSPMAQLTTPEVGGDTAVALAFSGGGTRAAAFAYGVLRGLDRVPTKDGKNIWSESSLCRAFPAVPSPLLISGSRAARRLPTSASVPARNAEEDLNTAVNLRNIAQGLGGGVNDASRLTGWLDRNLFDHATLGDLFQQGRPIVWINASDLYNRTPFCLPGSVSALCSDIRNYPFAGRRSVRCGASRISTHRAGKLSGRVRDAAAALGKPRPGKSQCGRTIAGVCQTLRRYRDPGTDKI